MSDDPLISLHGVFTEFRAANPERMPDARWVMDLGAYKAIRAAIPGEDGDPDEWAPAPGETMFGVPVKITRDGGKPHLEIEWLTWPSTTEPGPC